MDADRNTFDRYHRQMLLPGIGWEGQQRLRDSRVLLVGCGALGTVIADALVRAGIGAITIVDRDIVELTNLQRQILFDEGDAANAVPKAIAARRRLSQVNKHVRIDAHVEDFNSRNAERLAEHAQIVLDGLDNFETRYLLNDLAVKHELPYIYGGAVGTTGMSMAVVPQRAVATSQRGPCLRCIFPEAPPPGSVPSCDTAGVLGPAVMMVAAFQAAQAIKWLTGNIAAVERSLLSVDLWSNELQRFDITTAAISDCPCCGRRQFEYLDRAGSDGVTTLCGRNAVQISPTRSSSDKRTQQIALEAIASRLEAHGKFKLDDVLLHGHFTQELGESGEPIELLLFNDGRAIIRGTHRPEHARSIYARYIGL